MKKFVLIFSVLMLVALVFVPHIDAKGSSPVSKPSVSKPITVSKPPASKPSTTKPSTSKPATTPKPESSNQSTAGSKPVVNSKPVSGSNTNQKQASGSQSTAKPSGVKLDPTGTTQKTGINSSSSSFSTVSNWSTNYSKGSKFNWSRPYKSLKTYDFSNASRNLAYYGNSFLDSYVDYLIVESLIEDEETGKEDNDAWLLFYMMMR